MRTYGLALLLGIATVIAPHPVHAANCDTCLGKLMNVVSPTPAFPLSGFSRMRHASKSSGVARVLFVGTQLQGMRTGQDDKSATERWPLMKALTQFGRFTGVRRLPRVCGQVPSSPFPPTCEIESYDWSHARYTSRYVTFSTVELLGTNGKPLDTARGDALTLYNRYSRHRHSQFKHDPLDALNTVFAGNAETMRRLPLVVVGNYEQTIDQILVRGVLQTAVQATVATPGQPAATVYSGLSFSDIQKTLAAGKPGPLVEQVNAQANVITALICHTDGKRPASVCGRGAIKTILKHVK
jgi:hypothetical protein